MTSCFPFASPRASTVEIAVYMYSVLKFACWMFTHAASSAIASGHDEA